MLRRILIMLLAVIFAASMPAVLLAGDLKKDVDIKKLEMKADKVKVEKDNKGPGKALEEMDDDVDEVDEIDEVEMEDMEDLLHGL